MSSTVSAGHFFSAILKDNHLYMSGINANGQLGLKSNTRVETFTQVPGGYKKISCGAQFAVAIDENGFLWGTGRNTEGQLGLGDYSDRNEFTQIGTKTWLDVACGASYVIAIDVDKKIWSWGLNTNGQLGNGTTTTTNIPTLIENTLEGTTLAPAINKEWKKVFCGYTSSYAIDADGFLYGFGENSYNKIGTTTTNSKVPNKIGTKKWLTGGGGYAHTMLIDENGFLWGIGEGDSGQIGRGSTAHLYTLTQIGTKKWLNVACGFRHTMLIDENGFLWGTGRNAEFQLGNGNDSQVNSLTQIGTKKWLNVACGYYHTIAIDDLNNSFGIGRSVEGQIGISRDGTTPTQITKFISSLISMYLFTTQNNAYTIENGTLKSLGTITTANASTLFKSGVETITKEHCTLVGQQLGKAKIMRMLV